MGSPRFRLRPPLDSLLLLFLCLRSCSGAHASRGQNRICNPNLTARLDPSWLARCLPSPACHQEICHDQLDYPVAAAILTAPIRKSQKARLFLRQRLRRRVSNDGRVYRALTAAVAGYGSVVLGGCGCCAAAAGDGDGRIAYGCCDGGMPVVLTAVAMGLRRTEGTVEENVAAGC